MRRLRRRALGVALVACLGVALAPDRAPAGDASLRYQFAPGGDLVTSQWYDQTCTMTATVFLQELEDSGVNRLRAKFEVKGPNSSGWMPSYTESRWVASGEFPSDARSYWWDVTLSSGTFTQGLGTTVAVWVKLVGERPSFWKPDLTAHVKVGDSYCDFNDPTVTPPPVITPRRSGG